MGKNAQRRREAKLQKNLNVQSSEVELSLSPESALPLPAVFHTDEHEQVTEELVSELVKNGWSETEVRQFKELGMKYCRERNSFLSPPQSLCDWRALSR